MPTRGLLLQRSTIVHSMKDLIRESALGQIIRLISRNKLLRHPEEEPDFQNPYDKPVHEDRPSENPTGSNGESGSSTLSEGTINEAAKPTQPEDTDKVDIEKAETDQPHSSGESLVFGKVVTSTGHILVTWYTTDDPANPQNWSSRKKGFVSCLIW